MDADLFEEVLNESSRRLAKAETKAKLLEKALQEIKANHKDKEEVLSTAQKALELASFVERL